MIIFSISTTYKSRHNPDKLKAKGGCRARHPIPPDSPYERRAFPNHCVPKIPGIMITFSFSNDEQAHPKIIVSTPPNIKGSFKNRDRVFPRTPSDLRRHTICLSERGTEAMNFCSSGIVVTPCKYQVDAIYITTDHAQCPWVVHESATHPLRISCPQFLPASLLLCLPGTKRK